MIMSLDLINHNLTIILLFFLPLATLQLSNEAKSSSTEQLSYSSFHIVWVWMSSRATSLQKLQQHSDLAADSYRFNMTHVWTTCSWINKSSSTQFELKLSFSLILPPISVQKHHRKQKILKQKHFFLLQFQIYEKLENPQELEMSSTKVCKRSD